MTGLDLEVRITAARVLLAIAANVPGMTLRKMREAAKILGIDLCRHCDDPASTGSCKNSRPPSPKSRRNHPVLRSVSR